MRCLQRIWNPMFQFGWGPIPPQSMGIVVGLVDAPFKLHADMAASMQDMYERRSPTRVCAHACVLVNRTLAHRNRHAPHPCNKGAGRGDCALPHAHSPMRTPPPPPQVAHRARDPPAPHNDDIASFATTPAAPQYATRRPGRQRRRNLQRDAWPALEGTLWPCHGPIAP